MVGTTRPRVSLFMQRFHNLGLIETNRDRFLVIKENKLTAYLAQITSRLLKKTHMLRCAQSPRSNVPAKYVSARRFFARLASESF